MNERPQPSVKGAIASAAAKMAGAAVASLAAVIVATVSGASRFSTALIWVSVALAAAGVIARLRYKAANLVVGTFLLFAVLALGWALAVRSKDTPIIAATKVTIQAVPDDLASAPTGAAYCSAASEVTDRTDALRCQTEDGTIYDPCFTRYTRDVAWCPNPTDDPMLFAISSPDDVIDKGDFGERQDDTSPWAIRLEDGPWCVRVGHTVEIIQGNGIFHICEDETTEVLGDVDTSGRVWTVPARAQGDAGFAERRVSDAWR